MITELAVRYCTVCSSMAADQARAVSLIALSRLSCSVSTLQKDCQTAREECDAAKDEAAKARKET